MALDEQVIASRLAVLDENLRLLAPFARLDASTFAADPRNYGAAERFLQLAIESVFDIGTHCIAALGMRRPSTYAELGERGDPSLLFPPHPSPAQLLHPGRTSKRW